MNKYIKLLAVNFCIAGTAVFLYSPGLLCLRLSDESVFRAGMSILAAPALMGAFFFANTALLKEPKRKPFLADEIPDLEQAKKILKDFGGSKYLKSLAETASEQLDRICKCQRRLSDILEQRFTKGTLSWDKFHSVVSAAEQSAVKNVAIMASRMQLFDEKEYGKLLHYREDDIPDDIQKERLGLYQKNLGDIRNTVALNEKILFQLDALSMELSSSAFDEGASRNDMLLKEIKTLIDETKYYQ